MADPSRSRFRIFSRLPWPETKRITAILRKETIGGLLLLIAATVALIWANSRWSEAYEHLREFSVGPESLHLHLTLEEWAADGLLAIFFFVAGLELKREFVVGDLRSPYKAALPVTAAIAGVVIPATLFIAVNAGDGQALRGWAIPTATDIAFALAVLAVIGAHLPSTLRTFLLTLAVVDDLIAILIIALFYTEDLAFLPLLLALLPLAAFTMLVQRRVRSGILLVPLALLTWGLVHASGIHATVAGVLLAFAVPVAPRRNSKLPGSDIDLAERFEHWWHPASAGFAVPIFAFMSAGVTLGGITGLKETFSDPVAIGIVLGLVVGKPIGVFCATYLVARFTRASLDDELAWVDIFGISLLAGIGFTVSLLIGDLAFGTDSLRDDHVKIAVLAGSVTAALLAVVVLRLRNRAYRRIQEIETADTDHDGVPDVYGT